MEIVNNIDSHTEEAFSALRANIQFNCNKLKIQTLTVTSPSPNIGKTTIALNLAIAFAKTNIKVVLVDSDMRKPTIFKNLSQTIKYGLAVYFQHKTPLDDILTQTNIPNLSYISCGPVPSRPAEIIASKEFTEFVDMLKDQFDMIIFDTPFLGNIVDSAIIASQTDATLLVVQIGLTSKKSFRQAKEQIEKANGNIIGVVANKVSKGILKERFEYIDYFENMMKN